MLYIILHILLGDFLILYISNIDRPRNMGLLRYKPENKVIFIVGNVAIAFFSMLFMLYVPSYLLSFLVRVSFLFCLFIMVNIGLYFLSYAECLDRVVAVFLKIGAFIAGFFLLLVKIKNIKFSYDDGFIIDALPVFPSYPGLEWCTWFTFSMLLFGVLIPAVCAVIMVVELLLKRRYGALRQAGLNVLSLLIPWAGMYFIYFYANDAYPLSPVLLFMMTAGIEALMIKRTQRMDLNAVHFSFFVANIAQYVIPALATALVYKLLHGVYEVNAGLFFVLFCLLTEAILFLTNEGGEVIITWRRAENKKSMDRFENELKHISYGARKSEITSQFYLAIKKYLRSERIRLFVLGKPETFSQVYCSGGDGTESAAVTLNEAAERMILKLKKVLVRKAELEGSEEFEKSKKDIEALFANTGASAFIVISSANHISALLFLDRKKGGTDYNKYDVSSVTHLYSYFFIFSYYMMNVASKNMTDVLSDGRTSVQQYVNALAQKKERIVSEKYDADFFAKQAAIPGGDYIDCMNIGRDRALFILGNVSGRGIGTSVSTMLLKSAVRSFMASTKDFKQLVLKVNGYIHSYLPKGTVFSGLFAIADFSTNDFYYINCGIPALMVFTKNLNKTIEVQGTGRMLGFVPDISKLVAVRKVHLNKDDILFTYTNGIIDAKTVNGSYLRKDQITSLVQANTIYSAERIARFIYESFAQKEDLENDVSIMVLKQKQVLPV